MQARHDDTTAPTRCLNVYVVEDSAPVRERIEAMLGEIEGLQPIGHADTATAAIAAILSLRPEVVMLDVALAEGSGLDVLRAVHALAPTIDIVMLTNFASEPYRRIAERLGARGFFDKSSEFGCARELLERTRDARLTRIDSTAH